MDWRRLQRLARHLITEHWSVSRVFPEHAMAAIEQAIATSEKKHSGEIRFAVEASLSLVAVSKGLSPRARALEVFSRLRVWDTENNNGVLIYLLLADRDVEIIADRGIHGKVGEVAWQKICSKMEEAFRSGDFTRGVELGIREISALLEQHFPAREQDRNELSDKPVVI